MGVFDALRSRCDRPLDRLGRIGVHGDIGVPVGGGLDPRPQGSLNVVMSSEVRGDDTPPPPTSLIWEAPCRSCSRTRRRTSSALSAIIAPPVSSIGLSGPPGLLGMSCSGRKSPWPPVVVIMAPHG